VSIKCYVHKATETRRVSVPRTCSNCSHGWTANLLAVAEGSTETWQKFDPEATEKARKHALKKLDEVAARREKDVNEDVLCPKCGHFCLKAMDKHFPKGLATGLLKKYRGQKWNALGSSAGLAFLAVVALGIAIISAVVIIDGGEDLLWFGWVIFIGVGSVMASVGSVNEFRKYVRAIAHQREVAKIVGARSDGELLQLAVKCYRANNKSLAAGDGWIDTLGKETNG